MASIAKVLETSAFHACRVFRSRTGYTLHGYLTEQRLRRALTRLEEGRDLRELAARLGFANHSHFTAHFRRAFGVTPSEFRRRATRRPCASWPSGCDRLGSSSPPGIAPRRSASARPPWLRRAGRARCGAPPVCAANRRPPPSRATSRRASRESGGPDQRSADRHRLARRRRDDELPSGPRPPMTAAMASAFVTVARMTRAPPSFWSSATGSCALLSM